MSWGILSAQGSVQPFITNLLCSSVLGKAAGSYLRPGDVPPFNMLITTTLCELLGEGITEAGCSHVLSPNCSFGHFLLPIHSWEQTSYLCAERLTPTIFSEDQVRVLLTLHDPGDNFHAKPDQQHPQRGIKDEINKVAKSRRFRF